LHYTALISNHFGRSVSGPEKAGVGGSIPSLATNPFNNLATAKKLVKISRANNTRTSDDLNCAFGAAGLNSFYFARTVLLVLAMCCQATQSVLST
jgi:hypothetical protein